LWDSDENQSASPFFKMAILEIIFYGNAEFPAEGLSYMQEKYSFSSCPAFYGILR